MKFAEAVKNFTKFVELANNFCKVRQTWKNFMKFVNWKVRFKCLKIFLYLSSTRSNILTGKHKMFREYLSYFMNTFHK